MASMIGNIVKNNTDITNDYFDKHAWFFKAIATAYFTQQ